MKWTKDKSLRLSRVSVVLFMAVLAALCAGAPWLYPLYTMRAPAAVVARLPYYLISTYAVAPLAAVVLARLYLLLRNIEKEQVFVDANVRHLRAISWCCVGAGAILFVSGFYDFRLFALSAGAAFMGLIVRVVKNVIAEAVALKDEHDYTI